MEAVADVHGGSTGPQRLIIDTDPGIDDTMAIMMAFETSEVEVIGLTTIFGNVTTEDATRNALLLCEIAGRSGLPVAEGSPKPLKGGKPLVDDIIHGKDGLGNTFLPLPKTNKIKKTAAEFLVEKVSQFPGEVSVLALGPLTNLALAIEKDSSFASKVKKVVILGGAFLSLGNINPAAEANVYSDPEAADIVFTSGADIVVVGINITTQIKLTDEDLLEMRQSEGKHAGVLGEMCSFYRDWHVMSDGVHGVVRVETQGICMGHTLMDHGLKKWSTDNPWSGFAPVAVAWTVNAEEVKDHIKKVLMKP